MNNHNETIFFSPTKEYFTDEEVNGIDKFMKTPIVKGLVKVVGGDWNLAGDQIYEYESAILMNPTWFDLMSIAQQQSQVLKDTHHIWLEGFDVVGNQYVLAQDLGLSIDESSERKQKISTISLRLGS